MKGPEHFHLIEELAAQAKATNEAGEAELREGKGRLKAPPGVGDYSCRATMPGGTVIDDRSLIHAQFRTIIPFDKVNI